MVISILVIPRWVTSEKRMRQLPPVCTTLKYKTHRIAYRLVPACSGEACSREGKEVRLTICKDGQNLSHLAIFIATTAYGLTMLIYSGARAQMIVLSNSSVKILEEGQHTRYSSLPLTHATK